MKNYKLYSEQVSEIENEIKRFASDLYKNIAKTADGKSIELGKTYYTSTHQHITLPSSASMVNDTPYFTIDSVKWIAYSDAHYGSSWETGYKYSELWSSEKAYLIYELEKAESELKSLDGRKKDLELRINEYKDKLNLMDR